MRRLIEEKKMRFVLMCGLSGKPTREIRVFLVVLLSTGNKWDNLIIWLNDSC